MNDNQKIIRISSKIISTLLKVAYSIAIVAGCLSIATIIFVATTGGKTSVDTGSGIRLIMADSSIPTDTLITICTAITVTCAYLIAIFVICYKMFNQISSKGQLIDENYPRTIRIVGILVGAMSITVGIVELIANAFIEIKLLGTYGEIATFTYGGLIFAFSYLLDYAYWANNKSNQEKNQQEENAQREKVQ